MDSITVFSASGRVREPSNELSLTVVSFLIPVLCLALVGAASAAPKGSGKPPPGGNGGDTVVLPTVLSPPSGCVADRSALYLLTLNTPADKAATIVVATLRCGSYNRPWYWQAGKWTAIGMLPGRNSGMVTSVSDQGTSGTTPVIAGVQYGGGGWTGFVSRPGGPVQAVPPLPGYQWSWSVAVSADGKHLVGDANNNDYANEIYDMVTARWNWTGMTWQPQMLTTRPGNAYFPGRDASVVATDYWIWTDGDISPQSTAERTHPLDLSPDSEIASGFEMFCTSPDCYSFTEKPLFWVYDGLWTHKSLTPLAQGYDSRGHGTGRLLNGKRVIVGRGRTAADAVHRALAWTELSAGSESFGAPLRLAPIENRSTYWADAHDVNGHGQVVGLSRGSGRRPTEIVLWQLPQ